MINKLKQDGIHSSGEVEIVIKDQREELEKRTLAQYIEQKLKRANSQDLFELSQKHKPEEEI